MSEKDQIFSSNIKYTGVFNFSNFYKFCYDWLVEQTEVIVAETKYSEKLKGTEKDIEIEWDCTAKITDYFKKQIKIKFVIRGLKKVDVVQNGKTISTNEGEVKIDVKGILIRDYEGRYEVSPFYKFLRVTYDKWIVPSTIEQMKDKVVGNCLEFLAQSKAYLDLEGKK